MANEEICTKTKKRCYSYEECRKLIKFAKKYNNSTPPKRAYHCNHCGFWHLTHLKDSSTQQKHKPLKILNPQEEFDLSEVL